MRSPPTPARRHYMQRANGLAIILLTLFLKPGQPGQAYAQDDAANGNAAAPATEAPPADGGAAEGDDLDTGGATEEQAAAAAAAAGTQSPVDAYFSDLAAANVAQKAGGFFATNAVYEDPTGRYEGKYAIAAHLTSLIGGASTFTLDVKAEFVSGDETVAVWSLTYGNQGLA